MSCVSDLLLFKEYVKIISNMKGSDPEAAGVPVSVVAPEHAE